MGNYSKGEPEEEPQGDVSESPQPKEKDQPSRTFSRKSCTHQVISGVEAGIQSISSVIVRRYGSIHRSGWHLQSTFAFVFSVYVGGYWYAN